MLLNLCFRGEAKRKPMAPKFQSEEEELAATKSSDNRRTETSESDRNTRLRRHKDTGTVIQDNFSQILTSYLPPKAPIYNYIIEDESANACGACGKCFSDDTGITGFDD